MVSISFDNAALFIIDMQNDFVDGLLPVPGAADIINSVNLWVEIFEDLERPMVYSMDWHGGSDSPHFKKHPVHCISGTPGAQIHNDVIYAPVDMANVYTVLKGIGHEDGYSVCSKPSDIFAKVKNGKGVRDFGSVGTLLAMLMVDTVFVVGLATDYCVRSTVLDLLRLGKHVIVVADAIAGVDANNSITARGEMEEAGALFVDINGSVLSRVDNLVAV